MPRVPKIITLKSLESKPLSSLKNTQLHRIAVLIGASCSGTKPARIQHIHDVLISQPGLAKAKSQNKPLSLVSIDMGIRNLAYAHFTAARAAEDTEVPLIRFAKPRLEAWERLSVSPSSTGSSKGLERSTSLRDSPTAPIGDVLQSKKSEIEAFEPYQYASYAYDFIDSIIASHQPTHISIERQRFRSGGGSAVQEWTIRVGMFESMLYAVLRTLAAERGVTIVTEGILPTKVNRYLFIEGSELKDWAQSTEKLSGRLVKQAKVNLVASMLIKRPDVEPRFDISSQAMGTAAQYALKLNGTPKKGAARPSRGLVKLDDLADCLLQGLVWIEWQNNIERLRQLGANAFDLRDR